MEKKYIFCIHDKKSDSFDGFMVLNNVNEASRAFQNVCESNGTFNKWPEDFELVLVGAINYVPGEINEKGKITQKAELKELKPYFAVLAQAKDFVAIKQAKDEKTNQ